MADIEDTGFGIESMNLVDNSIATLPTANTVINILSSIHPVFSSDGKDNKLVEMSNYSDVLTQYGSDFADLNKYGQQNLNAQQVLANGGTAYICRLLPENAKTAHIAISIGVKVVNSIPLYKRDAYGDFLLDDDGNKIPVTVDKIKTIGGKVVTSIVKVDNSTAPVTGKTYYKLIKQDNLQAFVLGQEYYTKNGDSLTAVDTTQGDDFDTDTGMAKPTNGVDYYILELQENLTTFDTSAEYYAIEVDESQSGVETETVKEQAYTSGLEFKVIARYADDKDWIKYPTAKKLSSKFGVIPTATDEDGYHIFPLEYIYYYAHGKCGNNYGIRIINDFARDEKVDDGRRYQMFLVKKNSLGFETLSIGNGISYSYNPEAQVSRTITRLEGLQRAYQNYDGTTEKQIQIEYYQLGYQALMEFIENALSEDLVVSDGIDKSTLRLPESIYDVDFINGYAKDGYTFDNVMIDPNSVDLAYPLYLKSGTDGDFDTLTGDDLTTAKETILSKFFDGDIDTANFLDVLRCDGAIIYDANYTMKTKIDMLKLLKQRRDICVVFDCGETDNILDACNVAAQIRENVSIGGENYAIVPHFGITTNRSVNVRVSATYEFAGGITSLYRRSPFTIYAGKPGDNGAVKNMIFDWIVEETKPKGYYEKLAKNNRLYYAIDLGKAVQTFASGNTTGRNIYFFSNANLYSEKVSKLAEFRNGILVNDIRRILKLVLVKYTFDTEGADAAIAKAREELVKQFNNRYPANVSIALNLYQTERDVLLNQATCEVTVTFPDIFETWNCTIIAARNQVTEV